jgi:DNA-binding response OmpR family regulator
LRIFIVENHADTLKFLAMYLKSFGHQVESARTMKAALAGLETSDCNVLISDIGLPDGDGWELMRQAKFTRPVYAIAVSGFGTKEDIDRSMEAGFRHHLVKPFGGTELDPLLEDAIREIPA